jgi:bacterioferritin
VHFYQVISAAHIQIEEQPPDGDRQPGPNMMPVIISLTTHESLSTPVYTMRRQQQGGYMQDQQFVLDIKTIRERARREIENGAVTPGYKAKTPVVLRLLNDALATELVCILRYKRHYFMAQGLSSESVKSEFLEHAKEEQEHADAIAERIVQLGGQPNLSPEGLLDRSHSQYAEGTTLLDMIKEDLVAERIAIDSYRQMIEYIGGDDPTTRRLLEEVTAKEEEHAEDLASLLAKS